MICRKSCGTGRSMSQELESIRTEMPGGHTFRYLPVSNINDTGFAEAIFTTREGGVSDGPYRSLDLGWNNDDSRDNIYENYRIAAMHFGTEPGRCVLSMQTHTTNVRRITEEDAGRGLTRPLGYRDVDGMCTDVPGLVLMTLHADCTPLYFADPVHKAVGLAHSGWRGTAGRMGWLLSGQRYAPAAMRSVRRWQHSLRSSSENRSVRRRSCCPAEGTA